MLVGAGLVVAGSGWWLTLAHLGAPGGDLLWTVRLVVGLAMATGLVLGLAAVRRGDIAAHRAWMIRAYALAAGAGTQALTQGVTEATYGTGDLPKALAMTAGWLINVAVAEWAIRRTPVRRRALQLRPTTVADAVPSGVTSRRITRRSGSR